MSLDQGGSKNLFQLGRYIYVHACLVYQVIVGKVRLVCHT